MAGGLGESGQHGRFRKRNVLRTLSEIPLGSRLDAVGSVTQVDVVQVQGDDLLLGQIPVDLVGEKRLLDLPHVTLLRGKIEGFCDLLRDRASPLNDPARLEVFKKGTRHALHVEPLVLEEARIFCGDECLDQNLRDLFVLDDLPVFEEKLVDQLIVVGVDPRRNAGTVVLQCGNARQFPQKNIINHAAPRQCGADEEHQHHNDDHRPRGAPGGRSPFSRDGAPGGHGRPGSSFSASSVSWGAGFSLRANFATKMLTS